MTMNWTLTQTTAGNVFTVCGYLSGGDSERLAGATGWVATHAELVVLDLRELQGCSDEGQQHLAECVQHLSPNVVLCLGDIECLEFSDERLLALPRAHQLSEALSAITLLSQRNARLAAKGSAATPVTTPA